MTTDQTTTPIPATRNPGGRPRIDPSQQSVRVTIRLSPAQAVALEALGGAAWVRAQLDLQARSADLPMEPAHQDPDSVFISSSLQTLQVMPKLR